MTRELPFEADYHFKFPGNITEDEDDILAVMNMTELCAFLCMSRCLASPALKNNTTRSMCNESTVHPQTGTKRIEFISASTIRMAALYCLSEPTFLNADVSSTHYFKHAYRGSKAGIANKR